MATKQLANYITHKLTVQPGLTDPATFTFDSVAGWPTIGDWFLRIDDANSANYEIVKVTAVNVPSSQVTGSRAQEGTSPFNFAINSVAGNEFTAQTVSDALVRLDSALSQSLSGPLAIPTALGGTPAATSYGSVALKFTETLLAASAQTITITSIPATFRHLGVSWYGRGDTAAINVNHLMQVNNVTGNVYDWELIAPAGNLAVSGAETLGATALFVGYLTAANATTNYFASGEVKIRHYAGATGNKGITAIAQLAENDATGSQHVVLAAGKWRTAGVAINRLDFLLGAGNYIAGSYISVQLEP